MFASWFRTTVCAVLLLTAGCVFPAFSFRPAPSESLESESAVGSDDASPRAAVSPRARELFEQARSEWDEHDVCRQPSAAVAWLDAALEVQPDYVDALIWRGRALSESGYLEDAFDDFTRAIRLQASALAYAERGLVGLRLGNVRGAERDMERALSLDDDEPRTYVYRAALRFTQERREQACSDLTEAWSRGLCLPREKAVREGLCR